MENNNTHVRYCCCSKPLRDKLVELGFTENLSDHDSAGLKQIRRFFKNDDQGESWLKVEDSYHGVTLFKWQDLPNTDVKGSKPKKGWFARYKGLSVNKELLEHFSKKGIYNV